MVFIQNRELVLKIGEYLYKRSMLPSPNVHLVSVISYFYFDFSLLQNKCWIKTEISEPKFLLFFTTVYLRMSKDTYHVNEPTKPKPNITWKILSVSILFCLAIAMLLTFLKYYVFDDDMKEYGNLAIKDRNCVQKKEITFTCFLITFRFNM